MGVGEWLRSRPLPSPPPRASRVGEGAAVTGMSAIIFRRSELRRGGEGAVTLTAEPDLERMRGRSAAGCANGSGRARAHSFAARAEGALL